MPLSHTWTPEGLDLLSRINNRIELLGGNNKAAEIINREWGIKPPMPRRRALRQPRSLATWTPDEECYLLDNFMNMGIKNVALNLNRTQEAIYSKLMKLNNRKIDHAP